MMPTFTMIGATYFTSQFESIPTVLEVNSLAETMHGLEMLDLGKVQPDLLK
jgi:hypothetical protein